MKHHVTVKEEYVIYDLLAMIGSIGGTMGLFIGFSFANLSDWLIKHTVVGINKYKKSKESSESEITISTLDYRQTKFEDKFDALGQNIDERLTKIEKMLKN